MEKEPLKTNSNNPRWVIATMAKSVMWPMVDDETWTLTPPNRYIINAEHVSKFTLSEHISEISDLKSSSFYSPIQGNVNFFDAKILVERHRSRGIGDLLFLSGPLSYIHHMSSGTAKIFVKATTDKGPILAYHPAIYDGTPIYGPTLYDTLPRYRYHAFIDQVTEFNEEQDQPNVYDALFRAMGFNPAEIEAKWKRPSVGFDPSETQVLHMYYQHIHGLRQLDLRTTPYFVVAPFSFGLMRIKSYKFWLALIVELAKLKPVIVIGTINSHVPDSETMSPGEFYQKLMEISSANVNVIPAIGPTPLRLALGLISKAAAVICLDSAPLYMAQACRTPAISLWGTHDPSLRIGYDKDYMDLAIWKQDACVHAPCNAYAGLPFSKCPQRENQPSCQVLMDVSVEDVLLKVSSVLS